MRQTEFEIPLPSGDEHSNTELPPHHHGEPLPMGQLWVLLIFYIANVMVMSL